MKELLLLIVGAVGGFFIHLIAMKVSFKQRTIENKIKVYDSLIIQWVKMRNFVYSNHSTQPSTNYPVETIQKFDQVYGESQQFVGEAVLICEDTILTTDINELNEKLYRTEWHTMTLNQANQIMEQIKVEATELISRMREDIKCSTRFEWQDLVHIFNGFKKKNIDKKSVYNTNISS